jgi:RNA polymerase sigma-70 factor, ECF subfamily
LLSDGRPPAGPADGPGTPLVESVWLEPFPDEVYEQREGVELAFVAAVQHLPARQRAVLLLRDVLGFSAREVAASLETTTASVNSALQRARRTVEERLPARAEQPLGDARERELVHGYVEAWERHDVEAIRALLVRDAIFAMPPYPNWWHGRDAIADMFAGVGPVDVRHVITRANGQPAIGWYVRAAGRDAYAPSALEVLTLEPAGIAQITAFVAPALFARFGLPAERPR